MFHRIAASGLVSLTAAVSSLLEIDHTAAQDDACPQSLVRVYWQESSGLADEPWRDTYVFNHASLRPPNLSFVLHYDPSSDTAEWLNGHASGTNVRVFGLAPLSGEGEVLPFRWAEIVGDEISPRSVRGQAVTALIVNTHIYWPVCAEAETVENWIELASPPPD